MGNGKTSTVVLTEEEKELLLLGLGDMGDKPKGADDSSGGGSGHMSPGGSMAVMTLRRR